MSDLPDDIYEKAVDVAARPHSWIQIADAILEERHKNASEIKAWRDRWRIASFSTDADAAVADDARRYMKTLFGITSTWVDDDLRVLAHLADQAIAAGLTQGLPESLQRALEEKRLADRNTPLDDE